VDVTYRYRELTFVWHREKADENLRKHGIKFEDACIAFLDPYAEFIDASVPEEERLALIGMIGVRSLMYVVHVERGENQYRIVSAREAESYERKIYEDGSATPF